MTTLTPSTTATIDGANTCVVITLPVVATCQHGHTRSWPATDVADVDRLTAEAVVWAEEHADTCTGQTAVRAA